MESMDIQIIDPADLPDEDKPAAPNKKLIILLGFVIGILFCLLRLRIFINRGSSE